MDVRFSPEQQAVRDSAVHLLDKLAPKTVADLDDAERAGKLDAAVAAAGWRELRAPNDDGDPWASGVEVAIIAEELGRTLADTPFIGPTLRAELSRVGANSVVSAAEVATSADLTRAFIGIPAADEVTALGLVLTCADLVGVMRGATELATEYAKARQQYGVAVGSFQAVQHLLADAFVAMEGSRSVTLHAAWAVDALPADDALAAAALAKAYCARAARNVCETAIQVHGGIGNTWECMAHVYLRRALVGINLFGGVGPNLARVLGDRGLR